MGLVQLRGDEADPEAGDLLAGGFVDDPAREPGWQGHG